METERILLRSQIFFKLIAATLTLTGCVRPLSNESTPAETGTQPLIIGQLADYLIKAADDYNPNADRASVLEGFSETKQATRLQMFVLASRAFGDLPTPTGNGKIPLHRLWI